MIKQNQPWLNTKASDIIFILSPAFIALFLVVIFPAQFKNASGIPLSYWVLLIVFIDVAHVYSTLYRTYFNPITFKKQSTLLLIIPIVCYVVGVMLYQFDALWFWRILAYLAVYHFIRQQYGFMRLYSRFEQSTLWIKWIDNIAIYSATIYPLVYWHFTPSRNFNWFVEGDFFSFQNDLLIKYTTAIYFLIMAIYAVKECFIILRTKWFNIPKNLIVAGTFLSWYFGIVYFNGDMAFTTLNVIAHGIPYMALIWFFEKKKSKDIKPASRLMSLCFGKFGIFYFLIIVIFFAYFEEGLWDGLVWKEHQSVFKPFDNLPRVTSNEFLALLIPLLALPQSTHYVLDGFIWKAKSNF